VVFDYTNEKTVCYDLGVNIILIVTVLPTVIPAISENIRLKSFLSILPTSRNCFSLEGEKLLRGGGSNPTPKKIALKIINYCPYFFRVYPIKPNIKEFK
jgi:hypothetical protein